MTSLIRNAIGERERTFLTLTENDIIQLFDRWNKSLQTGNPDKVADNYAEDAILLPTRSNIPRTNRQEICNYFEHFLKQKPVAIVKMRVIRLSRYSAMDSGLYTFTLSQNGKLIEIPARYTFEYELINGKWLIVGHHSSIMPE
jgi:uncharacterized protein (TIGR02246 family)